MARTLIITIIFLSGLNLAVAQEYYYWANGKKYPLELYSEKQYILVQGQNKASVAQGLGVSEQNVSDLKPSIVSQTIKNNYPNKSAKNNLHWGFVSRSFNKEKLQSSNIIYAAPSFLVNNKKIGLSQYFYVKLKHEIDFKLLEDVAKKNKVEIVGNDTYMPLWYILSCDTNSNGNALEMANYFYETGHFSSSQPDLMEDLNVNCTNDALFNQQWHLNNTGQAGGTVGNDIKACQAWNFTMGCANIVVAVIDHGLEFNHPDFANISPISFDLETGTAPSVVRGSHGVAVAGVIGASVNNNLGIAGVAPGVQLMSISSSLAATPLSRQNRAAGINFAWQNGAAVINNSWSSSIVYQVIDDAIQNATTLGRNGL
jgi:subtilisin family serine protease